MARTTFQNDMRITGALAVNGASTLTGTVALTGNQTVGGTLAVAGNTTLGGTAAVTSNATVGGTLGVTGNTTLSGTLAVTGVTTLTGALTAPTIQHAAATATATAGAATLNSRAGKITSEALTTAQNATYTLTITNSAIAAADIVMASVANGTNTQGTPTITRVTPGAGSVVILVRNAHDSAQAFNGTLVVSFATFKAL